MFRGFLQSWHLSPLLDAIRPLPHLTSLCLSADPSASPSSLVPTCSFACPRAAEGTSGLLRLEQLTLNCQGSAWNACKCLRGAQLPQLKTLRLLGQAEPWSLACVGSGLRGTPCLELLEVRGCQGVDVAEMAALRAQWSGGGGHWGQQASKELRVVWGQLAAPGAVVNEELWQRKPKAKLTGLLCGLLG